MAQTKIMKYLGINKICDFYIEYILKCLKAIKVATRNDQSKRILVAWQYNIMFILPNYIIKSDNPKKIPEGLF